MPPGHALYNWALKKKEEKTVVEEEPIKPVLSYEMECELIEGNKEKVYEVIKTSQILHEMLTNSNIEKDSMLNALYKDWLFC